MALEFGNRAERIGQFLEGAMERRFQVRRAGEQSGNQIVVNPQSIRRGFQKSQDETINRQPGKIARRIKQSPDLSLTGHDEGFGFAQHRPRRNFDFGGDLTNQIECWGQSANFVMADDFEPVCAATFGGDGVFNRANDDFENWLAMFVHFVFCG